MYTMKYMYYYQH